MAVAALLLAGLTAHANDSAQQRADSAERVYDQVRALHERGVATTDLVHQWSVRLMEAEADLGRADAATKHRDRMGKLARAVELGVGAGTLAPLESDVARFYLAEAQGWAQAPVAPPQPAASQATDPPPSSPRDIDACFAGCDSALVACKDAAARYRVGLGELGEVEVRCVRESENICGTGLSKGREECRADKQRLCQSKLDERQCVRDQTQCTARCR